jgi:hypothetical protein
MQYGCVARKLMHYSGSDNEGLRLCPRHVPAPLRNAASIVSLPMLGYAIGIYTDKNARHLSSTVATGFVAGMAWWCKRTALPDTLTGRDVNSKYRR